MGYEEAVLNRQPLSVSEKPENDKLLNSLKPIFFFSNLKNFD